MRASLATARVTTEGPDIVIGRPRSFTGDARNGIVYCHGSGYDAMSTWQDPITNALAFTLGRIGTTVVADFGGETFGNDTAIARIAEAVAWLQADGVERVALVGSSMGACNALAYTRAHPSTVYALAGIVPCTDLADVRARGFASLVDAAYGGAYSDAIDGPTHSPVRFASALPALLPIHLWSASDDDVTPPATAAAFVAARPATGLTDLGPLGHTRAAIGAASEGVASFVRHWLG